MAVLASPLGEMKARYDVVVIGSGYGGGVAALRLAEVRKEVDGARRGLRVCVLERGREFQPGEFPRTPLQAFRELRLDTPRLRLGRESGLYDMRINADVSVLVGCGLGGTSLINGNVLTRPLEQVLEDPRWPADFGRDTGFHDDYETAKSSLGARRFPAALPRPRKLEVLEASTGRVELPLLAVSFENRITDEGVQLKPCNACGDCVSGCNYSAKRTVATNYLPKARREGAEIFCGIEARWLEHFELSGNRKWRIWFRPTQTPHVAGVRGDESFIIADLVVLAAGTLGTTEILHRSRELGLPLSDRIGAGFNGNGDAIAFGYNNDAPVHGVGYGARPADDRKPVGPTITGMVDERSTTGLLIQEGAIPGALAPVLRWLAPLMARVGGRDTDSNMTDFLRERGREVWTLLRGGRHGALAHTQTYLVMSAEDGSGRMTRWRDRLRIDWPDAGHQAVFRRIQDRLRKVTARTGGTHVVNPIWTRMFGRRLLTVHPLGGCCMAERATEGVVNHRGQVFAGRRGAAVYDSLYVCDGSIVPRPLGSNPLWTITALAERSCRLLVNDLLDDQAGPKIGWIRGDEPRQLESLPDIPRAGVRFGERMVGHLHYYRNEWRRRSYFELKLRIEADDLDVLVKDADHRCRVSGSVVAPALSARPLTVTEGELQLFTVDEKRVDCRLMRYRLKMTTADGMPYFFNGAKTLSGATPLARVPAAVCTMEYALHEGDDEQATVIGGGVVVIGLADVLRLMLSVTTAQPRSWRERWRTRVRFGRFYLDTVLRTVAWPMRRADVIDPYADRPSAIPRVERLDTRGGRAVQRVEGCKVRVPTEDGGELWLTCYAGGAKGPVILVPGFGTSTLLFHISTMHTNITEYLVNAGYEVWLLDYRGSERSAASRTQFTLDDIARYDYPRAVSYVREHTATGEPDVQVLGHCVASVALQMALLEGLEGVRSAICSQFHLWVDMPWPNRLKAGLHIAELLELGGFSPVLNPDFDLYSRRLFWLTDRLLHFYPSQERCRSPVCRRTLFLYGENFQHVHLNKATHDAVYDMFDRANLRTFRHLTRIVRAGRAVGADGSERYVDRAKAKKLILPITLLQGDRNGLFLPTGAAKTLQWLRAHGGLGGRYGRDAYRLVTLPGYGHMDPFIGRKAHVDVFPVIERELERGHQLARAWWPAGRSQATSAQAG